MGAGLVYRCECMGNAPGHCGDRLDMEIHGLVGNHMHGAGLFKATW